MVISKKKFDAILFSPHLDDAVLSIGGYVKKMVKDKKKVLIVTLFCEGDDTTFSENGTSFLKKSHARTSRDLFRKRKLEDIKAVTMLGAEYIHYAFIDALFRKNEKSQGIYPSFKKVFSGTVSDEDDTLKKNMRLAIETDIIPLMKKNSIVMTTLGVGKHVDHILTNTVISELFKHTSYWQDVPYDFQSIRVSERLKQLEDNKVFLKKGHIDISQFSEIKLNSVNCYRSQISGLRESGLNPAHFFQETLYF